MTSIPSTMRAWVLHRSGLPQDSLQLESAWRVPTPERGQALVAVHSAALNWGPYKFMTLFPLNVFVKRPSIPEFDFAGTVVSCPGGEFEVGDRVCGNALMNMTNAQGSLAEYTIAPVAGLVAVPDGVSLSDAAALPFTGLSSHWAIATRASIKQGERVFINGGTTSCGLIAIQVAKSLGAYVVATGNPASKELLAKLGADEVIDYRAVGDLPAYLTKTYGNKPFSLIYDTIGVEGLFSHCEAYLLPDGLFLDIAGRAKQTTFADLLGMMWSITIRTSLPVWLGGTPRKYDFFHVPDGERKRALEDLLSLVAEGSVRVVIDSEWEFKDAKRAYDRFTSWRSVGKVLVTIQ